MGLYANHSRLRVGGARPFACLVLASETVSPRTTQENIDGFKALYEKCVCRDTPIAETMAGVKTSITYN